MSFVLPPPAVASVPVAGETARFAVHRIYCVGRNYVEHAKEMGFTGREPPFFFMKPADAVLPVAEGELGRMHYPSLTKDLHHEVELVVAIGRGGRDIAAADAMSHVWGYAVGLDMTRRDLQGEAKKTGRPWCVGNLGITFVSFIVIHLAPGEPDLDPVVALQIFDQHLTVLLQQLGVAPRDVALGQADGVALLATDRDLVACAARRRWPPPHRRAA